MAIEYYRKCDRLEDEAMPHVIRWIQQHFKFKLIQDVRKDPFYQNMEVDLIMEDLDRVMPNPLFIEVKVRDTLYQDILIESRKNVEQNKLGWIWTSQGYLLAYTFYIDGQLHSKRYLIHMPSLREWFRKSKTKYHPLLAPNPPENPIYHTEFYPVPPRDIPSKTFLLRT